MKTQSPVFIEGRSQRTVTLSVAAAQTPVLSGGIYAVWSDVDTHIKVDEVADNVTIANGYLLRADETIFVAVESGRKIGGIAAGAGTLSIHQVGE